MIRLISTSILSFSLFAALSAQAQPPMSQSQLKESAIDLCSQTVEQTFGDNALVAVRQRVKLELPASRLLWHDGVQASVRMVLRSDQQGLSRVMCNVDQQYRVTMRSEPIDAAEQSTLVAAHRNQ